MYGEERHDVAFITPLQAMITLQDLEVEDIVQINNASADRLRHRQGFRDGAVVADDHTATLPDRTDRMAHLSLGMVTRRMALLSLREEAGALIRVAYLTLDQVSRSRSLSSR